MNRWTNTITMRELMTGPQSSPDGVHWEPSLPEPLWTWRARFASAWDVWMGRATAVQQTPGKEGRWLGGPGGLDDCRREIAAVLAQEPPQ